MKKYGVLLLFLIVILITLFKLYDYKVNRYKFYLNKYIKIYKDLDYDYYLDSGVLNIYFYQDDVSNHVLKNTVKHISVNLNTNEVKLDSNDIVNTFYSDSRVKNKHIYLTFDDGPNANTNKVLDILDKYQVKASFFVLGVNIKNHEDIIKRMDDLGMVVNSHFYSHKLLSKLSGREVEEEIYKTDHLIYNIISKYPQALRAPYGVFKKNYYINRTIVTWDVDPKDWQYHNSKVIAKRVLDKVGDGDIILLHDIYRATANSLEIIIPTLLQKGYYFDVIK